MAVWGQLKNGLVSEGRYQHIPTGDSGINRTTSVAEHGAPYDRYGRCSINRRAGRRRLGQDAQALSMSVAARKASQIQEEAGVTDLRANAGFACLWDANKARHSHPSGGRRRTAARHHAKCCREAESRYP